MEADTWASQVNQHRLIGQRPKCDKERHRDVPNVIVNEDYLPFNPKRDCSQPAIPQIHNEGQFFLVSCFVRTKDCAQYSCL